MEAVNGVPFEELTLTMAGSTKAGENDLAAFDSLMVRYQRAVIGTALRIVGNVEDARDVAQEVFYRLYKHLAKMEPGYEPGPWLYRVTVNVCFDLRRKRSELPLPEDFEPAAAAPEWDAGIDLERRRKVMKQALRRLPERERAAIVLREVEGLSTAEVAEALGSTEATVRSQVSMAKGKLREWCAALLRSRKR
jgi:RNA polymerase sigma-70 factor (ECF subfamily)